MKLRVLFPALLMASSPLLAEPLNYNVVALSASSHKTIARDTMLVSFAVQEEGANREDVANRVTQRLNRLLALAKAHPEMETALTGRSSYPYSPDNNGKNRDHWRENATVTVKSADFRALNRLIAQAQPIASVQNQQFMVAPATERALTQELTSQAIRDFRAKAQAITHDLGGTSYRIVNLMIGESGGGVRPMPMMRAYAAKASGAADVPDDAAGNEELMLNVSGNIQVQ